VVGGWVMGALPKLYRPPALCVFRLLPPVQSRPLALPTHAHTQRTQPPVPARAGAVSTMRLGADGLERVGARLRGACYLGELRGVKLISRTVGNREQITTSGADLA
jgi:hypothetical protein